MVMVEPGNMSLFCKSGYILCHVYLDKIYHFKAIYHFEKGDTCISRLRKKFKEKVNKNNTNQST